MAGKVALNLTKKGLSDNGVVSVKLNDRQEAFCQELVNSGKGIASAEKAGYASAHSSYYLLMQNPAIQARLRAIRAQKIGGEMASIALTTLTSIMEDKVAPPAARVSAAKFVLEMSGHGIVAQGQSLRYSLDTERKSLAEMDTGELEEFVKRQRAAMDALEDVSRSVNAPIHELDHCESTDSTALLGQFTGQDGDTGDAGHDPGTHRPPTPPTPPKTFAPAK